MSYSVDNIINVNVNLQPGGIGFSNFASIFFFATQDDLKTGISFENDTYRDYNSLTEVAAEFEDTSPVYLAASRWFAQIPSPETFSVFMWNDVDDSVTDVASKADDMAWRYFYRFPNSVAATEADVTALADWMDANTHFTGFTTSAAGAVDPGVTSDLGSVLTERGNRRIIIGYREADTVSDDASQAYADVQLMAAFYKFRPEGSRTAITGEYQVLPGVVGESLSTTEYTALRDKNIVFWTEVELQGSVDARRTINSRTTSSFDEFMDDVVNVDVLRNRLQVDGYNYIANAGTKRPYTPRGYAGLLATIEGTLKGFYDNGVLGRANYVDPETGEDREARYGYVIFSQPTDVFDVSSSQRRNRQFPDVNARVILGRAGHSVDLNVSVE